MNTQPSYVITGNGIAGITAAELLRAEDAACSITIVADDPYPVYYRPALKDYLGGRLPEEKLWARPATYYREQRIRFVPGRIVGIDTRQHLAHLHNGKRIAYDRMLLANGARPRSLSCPGLDLAGVSTLRTIADYQEILRRLPSVNRVVVVGSGTLALESAETLRHRDYEVTHLLRGNTLWSEVLDPIASDMVLQEERRDGIDVRTGEEIREIVGKNGQVSAVITTGGEYIACELVLIAIGIEPLVDFIRASGITCGRGVKVDSGMRSSDPHIFAAGDVIESSDEFTGRTRVIGQWMPSIQQAQVAAYNMLGLLSPQHPFYPGSQHAARSAYLNYYNATLLYGLDFVSIGMTTRINAPGFTELVAEAQARNYRKVTLRQGVMVGALMLGQRQQALACKRAIDHRVNLAPVAERLFAQDFDLDTWLDQQNVPAPLLNIGKSTGSESYTRVVVDTPSLSGDEYARHAISPDFDAFLVPVPHPKVALTVGETRLNRDGQGAVVTIGRQRGVALLLEHNSVSRQHAEIFCDAGAYMLRDKGSSNGSFVNNTALEAGKAHILRHHDSIRFGDTQFRFELRGRATQQSHEPSQARDVFMHVEGTELHASVSRLIPQDILRSLPSSPTLVLVGQDAPPRAILLEQGSRYTFGRDAGNVIALDDPAVSRHHAELFFASDGFYARDVSSRYGVFVNKAKINNAYHLAHGDRITLGNTLVYFSWPVDVRGDASVPARPTSTAAPTVALGKPGDKGYAGKREPLVVGLEHRRTVQRMNGEQVKFEIDMCIGCDRCMDACPVPVSSLVTIAQLNMATVSEGVAPDVARFTHECIMCGSCVPVCPVDNHRDLLMLSLKERLGVSWQQAPEMQLVARALPAGWTIPVLVSRLREQAALRDVVQVPDSYLLHMASSSQPRQLEPGEALMREGEYGRDLHFILEGRLEMTATDYEHVEMPVAVLQRGEFVGDDGMLTGQPYTSTVRAQMPTLVLQTPEQVISRLMELVPATRGYFERANSARSLISILKRMALFQGVADADLHELMRRTSIKQYERNERLFAQDEQDGRPARETLHILLEGFVKVARHDPPGLDQRKGDERIVAYRQGGDYFAGGLDLLGDGRAVSVTTINRCRVAEVPRQAMQALFSRYAEVNARFMARLQEYLETSVSTRGYRLTSGPLQHVTSASRAVDSVVQDGLHSLLSDGVVEGTEVLVIDLDKCIHCNECEEACARRHGHSRMNRKGMVVGNISIATACRQCQDPVCMLCSRAGIARHPNGEVYITESCIGCGICAERCPYGAISIVHIEDEAGERNSWQRFSQFFTKGAGKERARRSLPVLSVAAAGGNYAAPGPLDSFQPRNAVEEMRKKVAIKCDLCAGYKDQACVQACPTGAAIRIQPTKFFGSTEEILQRRTR
ncbi:MAG TPA: FAD-dependent oxidoreductase [Ktedonobacteraceae bacterium]|nr:FAD-dependent oxidoreductase [Ktedonobacteraceae bacterium]